MSGNDQINNDSLLSIHQLLHIDNNILTRGTVGALCQPPDERKEAGAYGYIQ